MNYAIGIPHGDVRRDGYRFCLDRATSSQHYLLFRNGGAENLVVVSKDQHQWVAVTAIAHEVRFGPLPLEALLVRVRLEGYEGC